MLKYIYNTCDTPPNGEYWINKEIAAAQKDGYRVLNAGVNDRDGRYMVTFTVWAVMIKEE